MSYIVNRCGLQRLFIYTRDMDSKVPESSLWVFLREPKPLLRKEMQDLKDATKRFERLNQRAQLCSHTASPALRAERLNH